MTYLDYAVLLGYFIMMAGIGLWAMRRIKVQEDYFMGGRGFGKLLQTFAAFGAGTGSSDPVNTGRTTFTSGMSGMWSVMYWLFVTPFYWITAVWYRRMRLFTLGEWFAERYESRAMGAAYTVFGLLFYVVYGSMLFSAIGKVAAPMIGSGTFALGGQQIGIEYLLVPIIGLVVLIYGVAGGLEAAYWTDLVQGLCIILLSVMLLPFGLNALVEKFGDPNTQGLMDGFRIMHEQVPKEYFAIVGSGTSSEFPLHFVIAVVLINLVGIVVQPHFIVTGGGSAKTEMNARVGLVVGNFLKRFCTIGWALTALIALALYADSPVLADDPDKVWGVASRELLPPGLTGLMLACLLAALMSSVDAQMIVGSALVVRNIYRPYFNPNATEKASVLMARITGGIVVGGAVAVSLSIMNVFEQLQLTWIVGVLFAAPFWIGMYWRRATTAAAWSTVAFCALAFFLVPWFTPVLMPDLRTNPTFLKMNEIVDITTTRTAAPADVARRNAQISLWEKAPRGARPEPLTTGESMTEIRSAGGSAAYWSGGVKPVDEKGQVDNSVVPEPVGGPEATDDHTTAVVKRYPEGTRLKGFGNFNVDFLLYDLVGMDLTAKTNAQLKTLELPPKIVTPFLVMILISLLTPRNSREALDRYYVKMKTPVNPDPAKDAREIELSYRNPDRFDHRKLFPGTSLEFQKPTAIDAIGFVLCIATCFAIVGLAVWAAGIGS